MKKIFSIVALVAVLGFASACCSTPATDTVDDAQVDTTVVDSTVVATDTVVAE